MKIAWLGFPLKNSISEYSKERNAEIKSNLSVRVNFLSIILIILFPTRKAFQNSPRFLKLFLVSTFFVNNTKYLLRTINVVLCSIICSLCRFLNLPIIESHNGISLSRSSRIVSRFTKQAVELSLHTASPAKIGGSSYI